MVGGRDNGGGGGVQMKDRLEIGRTKDETVYQHFPKIIIAEVK